MLHKRLLMLTLMALCWGCVPATDTSCVQTAAAASTFSTFQPVGQKNGWRLLFSDEFDGTLLDRDKWVTCYWWDQGGCTNLGNNELQWYQPKNVTMAGGYLRLRAEPDELTGYRNAQYHYSSGLISSGRNVDNTARAVKFEFQYGYAEMRARVPAGRGFLAAFWMLPSTDEPVPEMDVMEVVGQQPNILHMHVHYRGSLGVERECGSKVETPDLSTGWHVYGMDWQPDRIVWYLDGVERWRYEVAEHIPNQPMYILVDLAVGGDWPGPPDSSTPWPSDMLVDYVRVWQRRD